MPKTTIVKVIKRKNNFRIFINDEKIQDADLNECYLDQVEEFIFQAIARACGYDLNNEDSYSEYCSEFWEVDFLDPDSINDVSSSYNVKAVFNGFGKQGVARSLCIATHK